jgi:hypothetical protein
VELTRRDGHPIIEDSKSPTRSFECQGQNLSILRSLRQRLSGLFTPRAGLSPSSQGARCLGQNSPRNWVRQAEIEEGKGEGLFTEEREELKRLRREVKIIRQEKQILKKAAA